MAVMEAVRIGPGFAAEVRGVSLVDVATNDAAYAFVRAAFEEHSVLRFRNQPTTDEVQVAFSRRFGPLETTKVGSSGAGSLFARIRNTDEAGRIVSPTHRQSLASRANQLWHTDSSFKAIPALASALSARIVPSAGGQTEFASTRLAWERLPAARQARLRDLAVGHSYATSRDQIDPTFMTAEERAALPPVRWRMTWPNPANGRRSLYVASHAFGVEGMSDNEGKALLAELIWEATRPEHVWTQQWRPGDVVLWDNRATLHRGRPWVGGDVRNMVRTTISARDQDGLSEVRLAA